MTLHVRFRYLLLRATLAAAFVPHIVGGADAPRDPATSRRIYNDIHERLDIRGNAIPVCPQGGIYTLNGIGTDPTCSHPGHRLR